MRKSRRQRDAEKALRDAVDYEGWFAAAQELEILLGRDEWRDDPRSPDYDHELVAERMHLLRSLRRKGEPNELMYELSQGLHWNLGNIGNPANYRHSLIGTKRLIDDYLAEVVRCLDWICDSDLPGVTRARKMQFFDELARSYGRSALMLSGGATMGLFHVGVVKALYLQGLLPNVISGSSAGSLVGAVLATRSPDEADQLLDPDNMFVDLWALLSPREAWNRGGLMDQDKLRRGIEQNMEDLCFDESFERSGLAINITVSPTDPNQPPRLLNYMTFPHLYLREAVLASCAVPFLFPPVHLATRNSEGERESYMPSLRWADGSLKSDLPRLRLRRLYNVNHFIVSQTNPHVVPFISTKEPHEGGIGHAARNYIYSSLRSQAQHALHAIRTNIPRQASGLRRGLDDLHGVLTQDYRGNVTISPGVDPRSYLRVIGNPRRADTLRMILQGERATWPRLAMIRHQTLISTALVRCLESLRSRRKAHRAQSAAEA